MDIRSKNLKVLEVNTEGKLFDTGLSNNSFGFDAKTRSQQKQKKKNQMGLYQTKKLLPSKGNHQQKGNLWNGRKYLQTTYLVRG